MFFGRGRKEIGICKLKCSVYVWLRGMIFYVQQVGERDIYKERACACVRACVRVCEGQCELDELTAVA